MTVSEFDLNLTEFLSIQFFEKKNHQKRQLLNWKIQILRNDFSANSQL